MKERDRISLIPRKAVLVCSMVTWMLIGLICSQHLMGRAQIYGSVVYPLILGALVSTIFPLWIDSRLPRSVGLGMLGGWLLSAIALMVAGLMQSGAGEFTKVMPGALLVYFFGLPAIIGVPMGAAVGLATCLFIRSHSENRNS